MSKETRTDGFEKGLTEQTEMCAWCGGNIPPYCSCYYGGQRVGNVIICKNCGDRASAEEDLAKYGH
jgi:hypothetical protein